MFKQITLKNYRTHRKTTLDLGPVTLLIGNNNSGKSNLLAGIQLFSWIIRRGDPKRTRKNEVEPRDFFPHRYRLAKDDEGMSIFINWQNEIGKITYEMDIYKGKKSEVACKEKIETTLSEGKENLFMNGFDQESNKVYLRKAIEETENFTDTEKKLCRDFFRAFAFTFSYHLQPSFLKGLTTSATLEEIDSEKDRINIAAKIGTEGGGLQELLPYAKQHEERVFSRFNAFMRRFSPIFNGVREKEGKKTAIWEFDLGRKSSGGMLDEFPPHVVSDGMLKVGAIALLLSLQFPPNFLLLEEIENGINPANIKLLMDWIWQATAAEQDKSITTQFILTSHSPSVLREFYDKPHYVYVVRLEKRNFSSTVTNLNQALSTLRDIGTIDEADDIESIEKDGEEIIQIPKYRLAELWYEGIIG